jgi:hypothetical protein
LYLKTSNEQLKNKSKTVFNAKVISPEETKKKRYKAESQQKSPFKTSLSTFMGQLHPMTSMKQ